MSLKNLHIVASILLIFAISSAAATDEVKVSLAPGYDASWIANLENGTISFELVVATKGWIGFGLSHTGGMANSDLIIAGVDATGSPYFTDRHAIGQVEPILDGSQDWVLDHAGENETHTFLRFWRKLETCDENDITIGEDTLKIIWSFGSNDEIGYHGGSNRGSRYTNFLDPPMPDPDISLFQKWVVQANDTLPSVHTSYVCTIHKRPEMSKVHHVVGFDTRFDSDEARRHTHHFIFRKCIAPRGVNPRDLFEPHIGQPGQDCKARPLISAQCGTYMFVWAIGGQKTMFPDHVGHPIAENGEDEYFMLEIHYNNPQEIVGSTFPTGLEIYYTDNLRENEAGIMTLGHIVYWAQTIPPDSPNFTVYGHCSSLCTRTFPENGLNVFNIMLHSHMSGRKLKLQHFRDEQELPWFAYDDYYDFNYQQNRPLRAEKKILPGDSLVMNCVCDTTWKNDSTVVIGDLGITDEMCEAFVFYYPRILIDTCMSSYNPVNIHSDFGIQQLDSAGAGEMDPIIRKPAHLNGTRYTTYLNKVFNWTEEFRENYQNRLKTSYHLQLCASLANFTYFPRGEFVQFPLHIDPYKPVDVCQREEFTTSGLSSTTDHSNGSRNYAFTKITMLIFILSCYAAFPANNMQK